MFTNGLKHLRLVGSFVEGKELGAVREKMTLFVLVVEDLLDHCFRTLVPRRRQPFAFQDTRNTDIVIAAVDSRISEAEPFGRNELILFHADRSRYCIEAT